MVVNLAQTRHRRFRSRLFQGRCDSNSDHVALRSIDDLVTSVIEEKKELSHADTLLPRRDQRRSDQRRDSNAFSAGSNWGGNLCHRQRATSRDRAYPGTFFSTALSSGGARTSNT